MTSCTVQSIHDDHVESRLNYGQDCLVSLQGLPDKSVHMVATSPPYYGLRDYGCDGQIGLEPTPDCGLHGKSAACGGCYVCRLVAVFREVRRVLRDDGTFWLNLGDSYATPQKGSGGACRLHIGNERTQPKMANPFQATYGDLPIKPKDLLGIPWRVAFALQADGWWLRQDIIWSKRNPLPSSVTDRCTTAHEYIFLLAKSERYFFDNDAIKEPAVYAGKTGCVSGPKSAARAFNRGNAPSGNEGGGRLFVAETRNKRSVWTTSTRPYAGAHSATWPEALVEIMVKAGSAPGGTVLDPFSGSGTTGAVAMRLGRNYIGLDLNDDYLPLAVARLEERHVSGQGASHQADPEENVLDMFR